MEVQIGEDDFSFECWGCLFSGGGGARDSFVLSC